MYHERDRCRIKDVPARETDRLHLMLAHSRSDLPRIPCVSSDLQLTPGHINPADSFTRGPESVTPITEKGIGWEAQRILLAFLNLSLRLSKRCGEELIFLLFIISRMLRCQTSALLAYFMSSREPTLYPEESWDSFL